MFQADIEAITQALDTFPSQSDITNENKSAQPHRPGPSLSPGKGISPLRLSSARKQRMPGSDMAKAIRADCDVEDLQLQLAVAVRQAEHFRRENATLQERNTCLQVCSTCTATPSVKLTRFTTPPGTWHEMNSLAVVCVCCRRHCLLECCDLP